MMRHNIVIIIFCIDGFEIRKTHLNYTQLPAKHFLNRRVSLRIMIVYSYYAKIFFIWTKQTSRDPCIPEEKKQASQAYQSK